MVRLSRADETFGYGSFSSPCITSPKGPKYPMWGTYGFYIRNRILGPLGKDFSLREDAVEELQSQARLRKAQNLGRDQTAANPCEL